MFLDAIPYLLRCVVLGLVGAAAGALINWAIFELGYFRRRAISPWSRLPDAPRAMTPVMYVPIVGWLARRRSEAAARFGRSFWVRPLLIEIGCAAGIAILYQWYRSGGLVGGNWRAIATPEMSYYCNGVTAGSFAMPRCLRS